MPTAGLRSSPVHDSSLTNPVTSVATSEVMIRAEGLGKRFKIYPKAWARLTEWLSGGAAKRHEDFWALRDVSFELRKGESLGVIGVNGSGRAVDADDAEA